MLVDEALKWSLVPEEESWPSDVKCSNASHVFTSAISFKPASKCLRLDWLVLQAKIEGESLTRICFNLPLKHRP